jgi:hypothetical protein
MTDTTNGYMVYNPTPAERFWRKFGYRYHLGDEPDGTDGLPGWMTHGVRLRFTMADRVRLLLTGRLHVKSVLILDTPSPDVIKARIDWEIERPGAPV